LKIPFKKLALHPLALLWYVAGGVWIVYKAFGTWLLFAFYNSKAWAFFSSKALTHEPSKMDFEMVCSKVDQAVPGIFYTGILFTAAFAITWWVLTRFPQRDAFLKQMFRCGVYAVVAIIICGVFLTQWQLRGNNPHYGFDKMLSFTAFRPFVYRVLSPSIVRTLTNVVLVIENKKSLKASLSLDLKPKALFLSNAKKIAMLYMFACLVALQFAMAWLVRSFFPHSNAWLRIYLPPVFLLFLPLTFRGGGYFYDFADLLFLTVCLAALAQKRWCLFYIFFPLAVLNKESSVLVIVYFAATFFREMRWRTLFAHLFWQLMIGGTLILSIQRLFSHNPGFPVWFLLMKNMSFWTMPSTYFKTAVLFSFPLPLPGLQNIFMAILLAIFIGYEWREKPNNIKRLFWMVVPLNFLLLLIGGCRDELRSMYSSFPIIYLIIFHTIQRLYLPLKDQPMGTH